MSQKSEAERYKDWYRKAKPDEREREREARRIKALVDYRYAMASAGRKVSRAFEFFKGSRRWGFMAGTLVFKFPVFTDFVRMISGFREQLEERYWWCSESGTHPWNYPYLNRIIWADRFGFMQISERCNPVIDEPNFDFDRKVMEEKFDLKGLRFTTDSYIRNFGYTADGRLVYIDYGYFGGTGDCYLGCPNGFSIMRSLRKLWWKAEKFVRSRSGRHYGVLVCRVEDNERVVSESSRFDVSRIFPHDDESVRSMLVNTNSTKTESAMVERVSHISRATHATRMMVEYRGLTIRISDFAYWRVSKRPAAGKDDAASDVTE